MASVLQLMHVLYLFIFLLSVFCIDRLVPGINLLDHCIDPMIMAVFSHYLNFVFLDCINQLIHCLISVR